MPHTDPVNKARAVNTAPIGAAAFDRLLATLQEALGLTVFLITHDLGVVSQVTQRMLVMYAGRVIEQGPTREIINDPQHPYTQGLINALPQMATPGEKLNQIRGSMPSLSNLPTGCAFHPRCDFILRSDGQPRPACTQQVPTFVESGNCRVACHMVAEMLEDRRLKEESL